MTRTLVLAAALLLAPFTAHAAERTGVIDVRDMRVVLPLPEGYVQSTLDMPEWVELARRLAARGARVEEVLIEAECMSDPDTLFCPPSYEVMSLPARLTKDEWVKLRAEMIQTLGGDTRALQDQAIARAQRTTERELGGASFSRPSGSKMVLVALDDPRSVRFYMPAPGRIENGDLVAEQLRVVAQFPLEGQLMMVAVSRDFPEGQATPEAHQELVALLDAFMTRLYALNPPLAAPAE